MGQTSARLLRLLSLFQARRSWSGAELAERLGVSDRTVRRDIDTLRELGYPVGATLGPGGRYRFGDGTRLPPLQFDDDQAVAIALALQTTSGTVLGLREAAERALVTLREVMPAPLRHQVDGMHVTNIRNAADLSAPRVAPEQIVGVGAALRNQEVLRFDYAPAGPDQAADEISTVRMEPHHLVLWKAHWYLLGYDLTQDHWQTFRLDRIAPRQRTGQRFTRRTLPADSVADYVMNQFDRGDTRDHWPCYGEAVVRLNARVVARWAPGGAVVEPVGADSCRITLGAWSWVGVAALLGTFDADLEIVGPPELVDAVDVLAQRYRDSVPGSAAPAPP